MKKGSKNFVQQNDAETEIEKLPETETIMVSDEEDGIARWLDQSPETESEVEGNDTLPEVKTDKAAENGASVKYRLTSLKRALENKTATLDREKAKVEDWRIQGKHRDEKATEEYEKRKTELEALLEKNEERYNKRKAKTQKYWWDFCINFENTKIKKIEEEVEQLKAEHEKLSASIEPKEIAA